MLGHLHLPVFPLLCHIYYFSSFFWLCYGLCPWDSVGRVGGESTFRAHLFPSSPWYLCLGSPAQPAAFPAHLALVVVLVAVVLLEISRVFLLQLGFVEWGWQVWKLLGKGGEESVGYGLKMGFGPGLNVLGDISSGGLLMGDFYWKQLCWFKGKKMKTHLVFTCRHLVSSYQVCQNRGPTCLITRIFVLPSQVFSFLVSAWSFSDENNTNQIERDLFRAYYQVQRSAYENTYAVSGCWGGCSRFWTSETLRRGRSNPLIRGGLGRVCSALQAINNKWKRLASAKRCKKAVTFPRSGATWGYGASALQP